jgi:hypothetical protein
MSAIHRRSLPGSAPGTLIVDPQAPKPAIRIIAYSPDAIIEKDLEDAQTIREYLNTWPVTWIRVAGLGDLSVIAMMLYFKAKRWIGSQK